MTYRLAADPRRQGETFSSADVGRGKEIYPPGGEKTNLLILSFGYMKTERPYFPLSLLPEVSLSCLTHGIDYWQPIWPSKPARHREPALSGEAGGSLGQIFGVCLRLINLRGLFYDHFDPLGGRTHPPTWPDQVHSEKIDLSLNLYRDCAEKAFLRDHLCAK